MGQATVSPQELAALMVRIKDLEGESEEMRALFKQLIKWLDTKANKSEITPLQQQITANNQRHEKAMTELNQMMAIVADRLQLEATKNPYCYSVASAQW